MMNSDHVNEISLSFDRFDPLVEYVHAQNLHAIAQFEICSIFTRAASIIHLSYIFNVLKHNKTIIKCSQIWGPIFTIYKIG